MSKRSITYTIERAPQPWARARVCGRRFYDGQVAEKYAYGLLMQKQHGNNPPFQGPLSLEVTFYMPPTRASAQRKLTHHFNTPDLDNLLKFLLDAASNAEIISDDRVISQITARKYYGVKAMTIFTLSEVE